MASSSLVFLWKLPSTSLFIICACLPCHSRSESQRKTAAIVGLRDGQLTFSDPALAVSTSHPDRAFRYMLNLLGRQVRRDSLTLTRHAAQVSHPSVKKFQERFPFYTIVADETRGTVVFQVGDQQYTVEELVGLVLKHAAENAARFAGVYRRQLIVLVLTRK